MGNSIKKIRSKYTGLLIRMDDIAEHMNWAFMDKCELLFDKFNLYLCPNIDRCKFY